MKIHQKSYMSTRDYITGDFFWFQSPPYYCPNKYKIFHHYILWGKNQTKTPHKSQKGDKNRIFQIIFANPRSLSVFSVCVCGGGDFHTYCCFFTLKVDNFFLKVTTYLPLYYSDAGGLIFQVIFLNFGSNLPYSHG